MDYLSYNVAVNLKQIRQSKVMSLIATVLFKNAGSNIISTWFQTTFFNFPVAFFWQMFYCGPCIRFIFGKMFSNKENAVAKNVVTE